MFNKDKTTIGSVRTETRSIPFFDEDETSSDALNISLSGIGSESEFELVVVEGDAGGGASDVSVVLNGDSSGEEYRQIVLSDGSVSRPPDGNAFTFETFNNITQRFRFSLSVGSLETVISEQVGSNINQAPILTGSFSGDSSDELNSIDISTTINASGRAYLIPISDN